MPDDESGSNDAKADEEAEPVPGPSPSEAEPENRRARRAAAAVTRKKGSPADRARERERERRRATDAGLDTSEMVDDALSRGADEAVRWAKGHFNIVQWLIVASIAGWIGWQIYSWRAEKTSAKVFEDISDAVNAELGRIGDPDDEGKKDARGSIDARRVFSTSDDRLKAAAEGYEKVVVERKGTPSEFLAKLGMAGVLYDQGKYADATKLYEEVYGSELAKLDPESRGRSLEGIGLSLEASGDRDGALKRFGQLENAEISGFRELALYNEGRLLHAKGDDEGAKERLKKVLDKLGKESAGDKTTADGQSYVLESARELLGRIDPKAVPPPSSDEALRKALEEFQKKLPPGVKRLPTPLPAQP